MRLTPYPYDSSEAPDRVPLFFCPGLIYNQGKENISLGSRGGTMMHLLVAIFSLILYVSGLVPKPYSYTFLALMWVGGAYAFLSLDKSENKKLAEYGKAAEDKDPSTLPHFEGEYLGHYEVKTEGLTDYVKVMVHRGETTFYGYYHRLRMQCFLRGYSGQVRVYHDGPFVLKMEPIRTSDEEENVG
jgi:hypothetical protein